MPFLILGLLALAGAGAVVVYETTKKPAPAANPLVTLGKAMLATLTASGCGSPDTAKAVQAYQAAANIPLTGCYDAATAYSVGSVLNQDVPAVCDCATAAKPPAPSALPPLIEGGF